MLPNTLGKRMKSMAIGAVTVVAAVALFPGVLGSRDGQSPVLNLQLTAAAESNPAKSFTMSGSISGLAPSVPLLLPLRINNPNSQALRITRLQVTVGQADTGCSGRHVQIDHTTDSSGPNTVTVSVASTVPRNSHIVVSVPVMLLNSAGNVCKGATFPLLYEARGTKA